MSVVIALLLGYLSNSTAIAEDYSFVLTASGDRSAGRSLLVEPFDFPEGSFHVIVEWTAEGRSWKNDLSVICIEDGQASGVLDNETSDFFRVADDVDRPALGVSMYHYDVWLALCSKNES